MVNDIAETSFWDKLPFLKPYVHLARWDRPIGFLLLFWPCVWGLALAPNFIALKPQEQGYTILLFFIGAIAMRGAGCTLNDILDRKLDAQVERTKARPLPSGRVKLWQAGIFLKLQLMVGAWVLFQLSPLAIILGLATIPLIATYPLMKRVTWGPQFFLALNFAAGAPIAWAAMENSITLIPLLLYVAGILWVIAYDTVYAHMDVKDDTLIGIKSTALWWGPNSKHITGWLFTAFLVLFLIVLLLANNTLAGYLMYALGCVVLMAAHLFWNPENAQYSLKFFQLQNRVGMVMALAALAPIIFK